MPLADVLEAERSTAAVFQPLPLRYLEVSHVLLKDAKDTFPSEEYYKVGAAPDTQHAVQHRGGCCTVQ